MKKIGKAHSHQSPRHKKMCGRSDFSKCLVRRGLVTDVDTIEELHGFLKKEWIGRFLLAHRKNQAGWGETGTSRNTGLITTKTWQNSPTAVVNQQDI